MISVVGQENMTVVELALFHARHEFSFMHGLLVVDGQGVKEPFSINTLEDTTLIDELYREEADSESQDKKQQVFNALTNAEHKLKNLNGLTVADGEAPEDTFILDNSEVLALIHDALCSLDKPCNTNSPDCS